MTKTKALLVFGGQSTEHAVSIMSAKNVNNNIDRDKFEVKLAYINESGCWFQPETISSTDELPWQINLENKSFVCNGEAYHPDVILPILHGQNGEDGMIAAVGQLIGVRVVGSDMTASAVSMDKLLTKKIVEQDGVFVAPYQIARLLESRPSYIELSAKLGEVFFVKPTRSGSSVGVSKVRNQAELTSALDLAFKYDDIALIEQAMIGRELEVAVLGKGADVLVSPVGEILVSPEDDFYSYEAKYSDDSKTTTSVSANLSEAEEKAIHDMAKTVYQSLRCAGLARVDFFLVDGKPCFNEINTLPGFTNISMYPKMIENGGLSQKDLITKLIEIA